MSRWADERAAATGMTPEEAQREGEAFEGAAADRRAQGARADLAPRSSARSRAASTPASSSGTCSARPRASACSSSRKLGVGVVLLDECHHLASLWGYVVRAVLGELATTST